MIEPTVGRVVWFYPEGRSPEQEQPLAALVSHVHTSRTVNLAAFNEDGLPYHSRSEDIPLLQGDDPAPKEGPFCCWMPYQKGQAGKADGLAARVAALESRLAGLEEALGVKDEAGAPGEDQARPEDAHAERREPQGRPENQRRQRDA